MNKHLSVNLFYKDSIYNPQFFIVVILSFY